MEHQLTIGKLALKAGVNIETIRFYERRGLIHQPKKHRTFRYYSEDYISKIKFIKRSQALGFSLDETLHILEMHKNTKTKCSDVLRRAEQKLLQVDQKIADLKKIKKALNKIVNCCGDSSVSLKDCSILDQFMVDPKET